jgi:hypothetical protein
MILNKGLNNTNTLLIAKTLFIANKVVKSWVNPVKT